MQQEITWENDTLIHNEKVPNTTGRHETKREIASQSKMEREKTRHDNKERGKLTKNETNRETTRQNKKEGDKQERNEKGRDYTRKIQQTKKKKTRKNDMEREQRELNKKEGDEARRNKEPQTMGRSENSHEQIRKNHTTKVRT